MGTALEAALASYEGKQTGENSQFRTLHDCLAPGDVALFDRYFSGWFDLALLLAPWRGGGGAQAPAARHRLFAKDSDWERVIS